MSKMDKKKDFGKKFRDSKELKPAGFSLKRKKG
jgi:hypothetical protein